MRDQRFINKKKKKKKKKKSIFVHRFEDNVFGRVFVKFYARRSLTKASNKYLRI